MWAVSRIPAAPVVCRPTTPARRPYLRGTQYPHKNGGVYDQDMGGIGHIVLSNLDAGGSSSASAPKLQIRKQENGKQLSGSDVLWALQRAAAKNKLKKKNKKKEQASSADTRREDDDDDLDCGTNVEVKPLCIKSEWAAKLDELDKRLQELSEFTWFLK